MSKSNGLPRKSSSITEVDNFLRQVAAAPRPERRSSRGCGRLLFGMDATSSRQPMWDRAAQTQAEMFNVTADIGGLEVQLAFYRGFHEFKVSSWTSDPRSLSKLMTSVTCLAGETQLHKLLKHARNEARKHKVDALVFVGDAFEEDVDVVGQTAGELGMLGLPAFMFHEGDNPLAGYAFQQVAKLSGGGYCRFDANSADVLRQLLGAVAIYASGGRGALEDMAAKQGGDVRLLADQMRPDNCGS
ncbi:MAG TPA: hypothetical protein DCY79_16525 [Planctomycetaceae bacterium]|nr:hypothetical protein [Planctomycetaceae bacterium]